MSPGPVALNGPAMLTCVTPGLRASTLKAQTNYVFHYPLILEIVMPYMRDGLFPKTGMSGIPAMLFCYVGGIALCFAVGWASWNGFEKHILKLKDRFPY